MGREEREILERFGPRYAQAEEGAVRRLIEAVIEADYGACGYTTRQEADHIAQLLDLGAGELLLDLGSGAGWPGLYLGETTGARVVLADLPVEGLRRARDRAGRNRAGLKVHPVVASGRHLPFREGSFGGIVHTDVLC